MPKKFSEKLKDFFKKNSADINFKNAGEGHRLCDDTRQPILNTKPEYIPSIRSEFSESALKAGEAALIRNYETEKKNAPKSKVASMPIGFKDQFAIDKEEIQKAYDLRDRAFGKSIEVEKPKQLNQVYYCCPDLFDYDIIGGYPEMEEKIFSYLESELAENPLLASCIIIHTKCKDPELLRSSLTIIDTLINNIIKLPSDPKFRKIRLTNEKIKQNIVQVLGAVDFLKAAGFVEEQHQKPDSTDETEPFLVMSEQACDPDKLREYLDNLKQAVPMKPVLYRDTNVFHKNNLVNVSEEDLPGDFFRISLDEVRRQNLIRKQLIEETSMLLTKAMRDNMKLKDKRKYRYVLIRVVFPNNWVLQGTFSAQNQVSDIKTWISDCLKIDSSFFLSVPPLVRKMTNLDQSIVDAELAPCSTIRLVFDDISLNNCPDKDWNYFLKDHLMS